MRIIFNIMLFAVILFSSCTGKKAGNEHVMTYEELEAGFTASLTADDTLTVLNLGDSLMTGLQTGKLSQAISRLYMIEDQKLLPISESKANELCSRFERFPVNSYRLEHCVFSVPALNDLKYTFVSGQSDNAPRMSLVLNPVKQDDVWYLCVKGKEQSSKDMLHPIHPKTPVGK